MKRGIIRNLLFASALAFSSSSCCTNVRDDVPAPKNVQPSYVPRQKPEYSQPYTLKGYNGNPVTKYAIVVVGSSRGEKGDEYYDPIDKNLFWLNATYTYRHLEELGFKHWNIYFLYADGKPDFDEPLNRETIEKIKRDEFNEPASKKMATINNLEGIVDHLSKKVDGNDVFVTVISTHGSSSSLEMHGGIFGDSLDPSRLDAMMRKVKPGLGLLYVDACHSGSYIKKLKLDDYVVISGTEEHTNGWGDRDFASSRFFFENLLDPESDINVDGKITVNEAFDRTKKESLDHMKRINDYLLHKYNWKAEGGTAESLKGMSVIPMIRIGRNVSGTFYLVDLMPHYKPL